MGRGVRGHNWRNLFRTRIPLINMGFFSGSANLAPLAGSGKTQKDKARPSATAHQELDRRPRVQLLQNAFKIVD